MYQSYQRPEPLHAEFKIGSVNGRMNFNQNSKAFHTSDIPQRVLEKKKEVMSFKDPDYLKLKTPGWNKSTAPPRKLCERLTAQIAERDVLDFQYNYRAESLHKKEQIYQPPPNKFEIDRLTLLNNREKKTFCDSAVASRRKPLIISEDLEDKPEFNTSTVINPFLNESTLYTKTKKSMESTKKWNELLETKGYKKPEERYNDKNTIKLHDTVEKYYELPPLDPECTFHPKLTTKIVDRRYAVYSHPGTYGPSPDGGTMWSCCLQSDQESRGCVKKVYNPDQLNVASI